MKLKIQEKSETLCVSCVSSVVAETSKRTVVKCAYMDRPFGEPVHKCNLYRHRNQPSMYEMEKVAWAVRTDNSGKILGFAPPSKEE